MDSAAFALYLLLFILTAIIAMIYYRRTREVSREFVKAKTILEDVIISFTKDLQVQQQGMQDMAERSKKSLSENAGTIEDLGLEVLHIRHEVRDSAETQREMVKRLELLSRRVDKLAPRRPETLGHVGVYEPLGKQVGISPVEVAPSIPIRREQALAPLTETELRILQLLDIGGDKTAPQMTNMIGLTREHTARLMKKLYVGGYIERRTRGIPYVYTLKNEMKNILASGEENP